MARRRWWANDPDLYRREEEEVEEEVKKLSWEDRRCSPEILREWLVAFIKDFRRYPTLLEVKRRFGGILGPFTHGWTLQQQGEWPKV